MRKAKLIGNKVSNVSHLAPPSLWPMVLSFMFTFVCRLTFKNTGPELACEADVPSIIELSFSVQNYVNHICYLLFILCVYLFVCFAILHLSYSEKIIIRVIFILFIRSYLLLLLLLYTMIWNSFYGYIITLLKTALND